MEKASMYTNKEQNILESSKMALWADWESSFLTITTWKWLETGKMAH